MRRLLTIGLLLCCAVPTHAQEYNAKFYTSQSGQEQSVKFFFRCRGGTGKTPTVEHQCVSSTIMWSELHSGLKPEVNFNEFGQWIIEETRTDLEKAVPWRYEHKKKKRQGHYQSFDDFTNNIGNDPIGSYVIINTQMIIQDKVVHFKDFITAYPEFSLSYDLQTLSDHSNSFLRKINHCGNSCKVEMRVYISENGPELASFNLY